MSRLLFWLFLKPLSLLPYFILYRISDLAFFILYVCFGYRKKVVMYNLELVFPTKTKKEREQIAWDFYRHFCDLILEVIKNFSVTESQLRRRFVVHNPEVLQNYAEKGQSIILCGGHYANWEMWALAAPMQSHMPLVAIYKRLSNPYFDRKMRESRKKYGMQLVSTRATKEYLEEHQGELMGMVFAVDQSPADPKKCVWISFLGIETPAYYGAEKYAKDLNLPVVFGHLNKVKRGYYESHFEVLTESPRDFEVGGLIQLANDRVAADIYREPYLWLWTHKRWKHKDKKPKEQQ